MLCNDNNIISVYKIQVILFSIEDIYYSINKYFKHKKYIFMVTGIINNLYHVLNLYINMKLNINCLKHKIE